MFHKILKTLSVKTLKRLQYPTGAFGAASLDVGTGYDKAWFRDNIYIALGLEKASEIEDMQNAYWAMLDVLLKHEDKIDWAIKEKPDAKYKYIHARFCPVNFTEFWEDWGNKQNDAVGALLFQIGRLHRQNMPIIRGDDDYRLIQKLVDYLGSIQYWQDEDNGVWEENEEVHASSIGACVAGLKAVSTLVRVPQELINKGQQTLDALLPRESKTKEVDLALLTLIYPYDVVTEEQKLEILANIEKMLVRKKGVIRYTGDHYYQKDGKEAEWVMGFPWLAVIYKNMDNPVKYWHYMLKTYRSMTWKGELPELYYGGTSRYNENTPLGWNHGMLLCAISQSKT